MIACGVTQTPRCDDLREKSFDDLLYFYCLNLEMIISFHKKNNPKIVRIYPVSEILIFIRVLRMKVTSRELKNSKLCL